MGEIEIKMRFIAGLKGFFKFSILRHAPFDGIAGANGAIGLAEYLFYQSNSDLDNVMGHEVSHALAGTIDVYLRGDKDKALENAYNYGTVLE